MRFRLTQTTFPKEESEGDDAESTENKDYERFRELEKEMNKGKPSKEDIKNLMKEHRERKK